MVKKRYYEVAGHRFCVSGETEVFAQMWNYEAFCCDAIATDDAGATDGRLGIREKWKVFEALWNRKNIYHDYYQALSQRQSLAFQDKLKSILG